jgi:hypothetical protein
MAILDVVETGHEHVVDLRHELERVRGALDRTDAVLGVTDDALESAEHAIETSRRLSPYVLTVVGVAAVGVAAYLVWRSRRQRDDS